MSDMKTMRFIVSKKSVGRRELQNELPRVIEEQINAGVSVPITRHGDLDAYLVPPGIKDLIDEAEHLRASLPILLAAARSGVALPSEILAEYGVEADFDWERLIRFINASPIELERGEDGEHLAGLGQPLEHHHMDEDDTELEYAE